MLHALLKSCRHKNSLLQNTTWSPELKIVHRGREGGSEIGRVTKDGDSVHQSRQSPVLDAASSCSWRPSIHVHPHPLTTCKYTYTQAPHNITLLTITPKLYCPKYTCNEQFSTRFIYPIHIAHFFSITLKPILVKSGYFYTIVISFKLIHFYLLTLWV